MIFNNNYSFLLRDSTNYYHKFYLSESNTLMLQTFSDKGLSSILPVEKNISDYSVDLDKEDKIHLILLKDSGELYYRIHPSNKFQKKLAHVNLKSNKVKFLTIKTIREDVHIFYMLNNKSTLCRSIYHSYYHNNCWTTKKVVDVKADKFFYPYMIDCTKNYIYLFYSKDSKQSYGIKKFNLDFYMWGDLDDNIKLPISHNASFLISDKNVAFICYNASLNRNIYTLVRYRDLNNNSSKWSKDIPLSEATINALHPAIVVKNNYTYILWTEGENIVYRKTDSGSINWNSKNLLMKKNPYLCNSVYISNHSSEPNFKNTYCPIIVDSPPYPVINLEKPSNKDEIREKENTIIPFLNNKQSNEGDSYKEEYIRQLQLIIMEKDKKLMENYHLNNELSKKIQELTSTIKEKGMDLSHLQQQYQLLRDEYEDLKKKNLEKVNDQGGQEDKISSSKEAATSLMDKNSTIERLNLLVNSLYQEINVKDQQIEELEQKLNKGIFRRLLG
ncbi:MAG TPA: hypothetical protein DGK91_14300 [Clostridium sp.]|nr:hypothetical protein [Clostridium sp.]